MKKFDRILPVRDETLAAFENVHSLMIDKVTNKAIAKMDHFSLSEAEEKQRIQAGMQFVVKNLSAAMAVGDASFLEHEVNWAMQRLPHDGVQPEFILSNLTIFKRVIGETMQSQHAQEILPYIEAMLTDLRERIKRGRSAIKLAK